MNLSSKKNSISSHWPIVLVTNKHNVIAWEHWPDTIEYLTWTDELQNMLREMKDEEAV